MSANSFIHLPPKWVFTVYNGKRSIDEENPPLSKITFLANKFLQAVSLHIPREKAMNLCKIYLVEWFNQLFPFKV